MQEKVKIGDDETTGELWDKLATIGAELLIQTLKKIEDGTIQRKPQPDDFTLAPMREKEIAKIDWNDKSAIEIKNLVRGLNPIMGAYSYINEKKIKFWKVDVIDLESNAKPGEVVLANDKRGLYIKAKDGVISIIEIQGENAKRMNIFEYLRGNNIEEGQLFN